MAQSGTKPRTSSVLNIKKCEVYWPGDGNFSPFFPKEMASGCWVPLYGGSLLPTSSGNLDVLELQSIITTFDDPQVEIHLLSSCLGICKINHPLRTVPNDLVPDQLLIIII